MPFERFARLTQEKRERILEVAAQEFSENGFQGASINRILERAEMSKGAAYYYFADKADLFTTAVLYASDTLQLSSITVDLAGLSRDTFWPTFTQLHRQPLLLSFERPWLFAVIRVASQLAPALVERKPLATLAQNINRLTIDMLKRGQELHAVRNDLEQDLLFAWVQGLDRSSDQWLMEHWTQIDRSVLTRVSDATVEAMRRTLAPHTDALVGPPEKGFAL
jgi:AcrR family transcriptional regulator